MSIVTESALRMRVPEQLPPAMVAPPLTSIMYCLPPPPVYVALSAWPGVYVPPHATPVNAVSVLPRFLAARFMMVVPAASARLHGRFPGLPSSDAASSDSMALADASNSGVEVAKKRPVLVGR